MNLRTTWLPAALAIAVTTTGCTTSQSAKYSAGISAVVTVTGALLMEDPFDANNGDEEGLGGFLAFSGMCVLAGSLVAWPYYAAEEDEARRNAPTPDPDQRLRDEQAAAANAELERRRARAWSMTRTAEAAARSGDCATVRELAVQVQPLDPDFYDAVFVRDVGIQRCLAETTPLEGAVAP